jgi:hypothetical protein
MRPSNEELRQFAFIPAIKCCFAAILLAAGMCAFPQMACGIEVQTKTTLTVSPTSVNAGTAAALTATVMQGTDYITRGLVVFCDANSARCEGSARFGTAQLNSSGTATLKLILGVGDYSIDAVFLGTAGNPTSSSAAQALTVNGNASYVTATTIAAGGSAGNYALSGTVAALGRPVPIGSVSFLDSSNQNSVVGTAVLDPTTLGFNLNTLTVASSAGASRYFAVAGDFNNDGKIDLAVSNGDSTVSVLLGNGDGTFQPQMIYNTDPNGTSYAIAVGDFNGDGNIDLVVTNTVGGAVDSVAGNSDTVSILLGNGDGTFQTQQTYSVGSGAQGVAVGDFNNDGCADVAVTNNRDNTLSVLLGKGDGTFQSQVTYAVGNQPSSISTADFNGDGYIDLVVSNSGDNNVGVLSGNGDGTFAAQVTFATGNSPVGVAVGDFNGDGNADIAVANSNDNTVSVLLGNGDGTFRIEVAYGTGSYPFGATVGDFNGDGKADIATPNFVDSTVSVLFGNGEGIFLTQAAYGTGNYPLGIAVGDFNGDGLADVATANHAAASAVSVLLSERTETATASGVSVYGAGTHNVLASYPGDTSHEASQSNTVPLIGVAQPTTTRLTASPNPGIAGQPITFTATVSPVPTGTPSGTLSLYNGTTLLGTATVNQSGVAAYTTSSLAHGSYSVTAVYSGNTGFATSTSSPLIETITGVRLTATTTTLAASLNPAVVGQSVAFAATVTPAPTGVPAGTMSFYAGTILLGTGTVKNTGAATFTTSSLAAGSYSITAVYSGNAGFETSTSTALGFTVRPSPTFTVTAPGASFTVTLGGSVNLHISLLPVGGAYHSRVTMSCSGLPAGATATFNPSTVIPGSAGASTVMTIQTSAQTAGIPRNSDQKNPFAPVSLAAGICLFARKRKRLAKSLPMLLAFAALAGGTLMLTGCSGFADKAPQSKSHAVTIVGTSGTLHASTTVTLVVQ